MEFTAEYTAQHMPVAVLRDGAKVIARIYLSPDQTILRIALPEMQAVEQLKIDVNHKLIDFRRAT